MYMYFSFTLERLAAVEVLCEAAELAHLGVVEDAVLGMEAGSAASGYPLMREEEMAAVAPAAEDTACKVAKHPRETVYDVELLHLDDAVLARSAHAAGVVLVPLVDLVRAWRVAEHAELGHKVEFISKVLDVGKGVRAVRGGRAGEVVSRRGEGIDLDLCELVLGDITQERVDPGGRDNPTLAVRDEDHTLVVGVEHCAADRLWSVAGISSTRIVPLPDVAGDVEEVALDDALEEVKPEACAAVENRGHGAVEELLEAVYRCLGACPGGADAVDAG